MKKSIIALALLSSAALAAEIPSTTEITNYTETTGNGTASWNTTEVDSPLDSWAFSFTVTVNSTTTGSKPLISMGTNGSNASGLSVVSTDGTYTTLTIGSGNSALSSSSLTVSSGATYTLAYDASTYTVYLGSSSGDYITYTFESAPTTTVTLTSGTDSSGLRQWTNTGTVATTITSVADLSSVSGNSAAFASYVTTGAVPEPATATLGLLALGALALRRRRA
ncbi:MAG: PEP-CTERM sorting domain-containing protein [Akkermansiaceae bacterium]|nr:PEP-CTERM sorting domain-containing protein [Akkermansiaceae bacterium]